MRLVCFSLIKTNPYRTLGAGSLLIICRKEATKGIIDLLNSKGIKAAKIGETLDKKKGKKIQKEKKKIDLNYCENDPYWDAFKNAIEKKLN